MNDYIRQLAKEIPPEAEFRDIEKMLLAKSMDLCGMAELPPVTKDMCRASGECICEICGQMYFAHPMDWRVIGYGNVPFMNILCDGSLVKL